jgi:hypothetical protein
MALSDPQTVTVSTIAKSMPRVVGATLNEGAFMTADGEVKMTVRHDTSRRTRHIVKLQKSLIVADPLFPSQNQTISYSCAITLDHPKNGVVAADVVALANALVAWATGANLTKVAGGEA